MIYLTKVCRNKRFREKLRVRLCSIFLRYDNIGLVTGFSYNLQEWITPVTGNMKNTTKRLYWVGILEDNNEAASY